MNVAVANARKLFRRRGAQELEISHHQRIGNGHDLSVHFRGRVGNADRVTERFAHLLNAVDTLEKRHRQYDLRLLPTAALNLAADNQIELLIGASELDVRSKHE